MQPDVPSEIAKQGGENGAVLTKHLKSHVTDLHPISQRARRRGLLLLQPLLLLLLPPPTAHCSLQIQAWLGISRPRPPLRGLRKK
eukprot:CAMPEP_0115571024 /NCGR_PEP_ID=MMETSP0271-20121206/106000_1 /TAXON_ID=71861 /ORGANISM="Scrippsiella trochoidea, Strain CCMP3099" /LENGTH=84 /DNA_ID=CAMNT_0003005577 /DNA_START=117 /DNA_END=371 /DNA_ORIENTATION=+